jgi:predicted RNA-binding protein with PUA-like domain
MNWFLAKTEPTTYSLDDLERDQRTVWDGVKNPQAVRAIREMQSGDRVYLYHSGGQSAIVGIAQVSAEPHDDPKDRKSAVVELEFVRRLDVPVTLAEVRAANLFADWALLRQPRLSTMRVPDAFVKWMHGKGHA